MRNEEFIEHHQTFTKINTLYKRDPTKKNKNLIIGDFSLPAFGYLYNSNWICEEKVDGTNVHWFWNRKVLEYHGKTGNADIPKHLLEKMKLLITSEMLESIFPIKYDENNNECPIEVRIYGEGHGKKIQKGGNYIKDDCDVRLFDVKVGNYWLDRQNVQDIADRLNIKTVPYIGIMTLKEAEELVKKGFKSKFAENKDYDAEGLICRPLVQLFDKQHNRVICKIKTCDY